MESSQNNETIATIPMDGVNQSPVVAVVVLDYISMRLWGAFQALVVHTENNYGVRSTDDKLKQEMLGCKQGRSPSIGQMKLG